MIVELDEVLVSESLWNSVLAGDQNSKSKLRELLSGTDLYCHHIEAIGDENFIISLRDLEHVGIVKSVKIET